MDHVRIVCLADQSEQGGVQYCDEKFNVRVIQGDASWCIGEVDDADRARIVAEIDVVALQDL